MKRLKKFLLGAVLTCLALVGGESSTHAIGPVYNRDVYLNVPGGGLGYYSVEMNNYLDPSRHLTLAESNLNFQFVWQMPLNGYPVDTNIPVPPGSVYFKFSGLLSGWYTVSINGVPGGYVPVGGDGRVYGMALNLNIALLRGHYAVSKYSTNAPAVTDTSSVVGPLSLNQYPPQVIQTPVERHWSVTHPWASIPGATIVPPVQWGATWYWRNPVDVPGNLIKVQTPIPSGYDRLQIKLCTDPDLNSWIPKTTIDLVEYDILAVVPNDLNAYQARPTNRPLVKRVLRRFNTPDWPDGPFQSGLVGCTTFGVDNVQIPEDARLFGLVVNDPPCCYNGAFPSTWNLWIGGRQDYISTQYTGLAAWFTTHPSAPAGSFVTFVYGDACPACLRP